MTRTTPPAITIRQSRRFPPADTVQQTNGWIAPDGTLYPCESSDHDLCAFALTGCGVYALEDAGWCHISYSAIVNEDDFRFTQPQLDTLFDMFLQRPTSSLGKSIWSWIRPKSEEELREEAQAWA